MATAIHETTWDENAIRTFVGNANVQGTTYNVGKHKVLFFAEPRYAKQGQTIADTCWKLWTWLGVSRPFTLILWWRDDPRFLRTNEWPSRRTVNGGWTTQNSTTIHVYRAEEWDRVFLHEMIHALGWDWHMPEKPLACWGLPTDAKTHPALFEAWTELYAEWLWCCWHYTDVAAWWRQRRWQDAQAVQILARQRTLLGGRWEENTSVFAYYVLKAALAPYIASLLLFGRGDHRTLCIYAAPGLAALRKQAATEVPRPLSLRMSQQS